MKQRPTDLEGRSLLLFYALEAMEDADALPVFGDMVMEYPKLCPHLVEREMDTSLEEGRSWRPDNTRTWKEPGHPFFRDVHVKPDPAKPTKAYARAVAAILMFESWPHSESAPWVWEMVDRCRPFRRAITGVFGLERQSIASRLQGVRVFSGPLNRG